jgi:hypothetical protein
MCEMIGYRFVLSSLAGRYITPWMSVRPSRALVVNGIAGFQPNVANCDTSAFSSVRITRPVGTSRSTAIGAVPIALYRSTTNLPLGLMVSSWFPASVVSRVSPDPSRPALYRWVWYTSWSASRPRALNHTVRGLIDVHQAPTATGRSSGSSRCHRG